MEESISRSDWLLLYLSPQVLGLELQSLTPIQIQKGMFLLTMRGRDHLYKFEPYNWGPFSAEIYGDLRLLELKGLVAAEATPYQNWKEYGATDSGVEQAASVAKILGGDVVEWIGKTRSWVTDRTFTQLLEDVYRLYPDYAVNSYLH